MGLQGQWQDLEAIPACSFDFFLEVGCEVVCSQWVVVVLGVRYKDGEEDYKEITSSQVFEIL